MGSALSKAANGVGAGLGNAFVAPFKTIFGTSCEGVCSGAWDIICFIEHLCISSLLKLLMVSVLACMTLLLIYLLFGVGIIQCLCRSLCKMTWVACASYCTALKEMASFLWHKLKNTKRVYRYQFPNMEESFSSSDYDSSEDRPTRRRRRRLNGERRKERIRKALCPMGRSSKERRRKGSGHQVRLRTREVSVQLKPERRGRRSRAIPLSSKGNRRHGML